MAQNKMLYVPIHKYQTKKAIRAVEGIFSHIIFLDEKG
jgi:hypothetical protein